MSGMVDRMLRAARLDANLYEEVEADRGALGQATAVVVLSSLAAGVGQLLTGDFVALLVLTVATLIGWYVWAFLTYFIGTRILPESQTHADLGELLRTIGFSSAPGLIRIFAVLPALTRPLFTIAALWMLIAMVVAVRQALDYTSTWRAVAVCLIGWLVQALILIALFAVWGPGIAASP